MVIEANRDSARQCVEKAREAMLRKDAEAATRWIHKAKKLDPECEVEGEPTHAPNNPPQPSSSTATSRSRHPPPGRTSGATPTTITTRRRSRPRSRR